MKFEDKLKTELNGPVIKEGTGYQLMAQKLKAGVGAPPVEKKKSDKKKSKDDKSASDDKDKKKKKKKSSTAKRKKAS